VRQCNAPNGLCYCSRCYYKLANCITFAESEPYCHSILFVCLSVWMSVSHSATYSLPRLIDHNEIWSAGIYLSSDPCKLFWIPYLPYFRCQREKYAKFRLFPTRRQWVTPHPTDSSYNSWSSFLIFGHNTLRRHTHWLTSAFFDLCPNVQMAAL